VKVRIHRSADALAAEVARIVAGTIAAHPNLVIGLPAGRTPIEPYRQLVAESRERALDWSRVRTFVLDELVTAPGGSPQPFEGFVREHLLDHVNVHPDHVQFLNGRAADFDNECRRYDDAIAGAGGMDLVLLGIGANGHLAFNEPARVLEARTHRTTLSPAARAANAWLFDDQPTRVPEHALSMGIGAILGARAVILIATGESKAAAVAAMIDGGVTTDVPASLLQAHPDATVLIDEAAATQLTTGN